MPSRETAPFGVCDRSSLCERCQATVPHEWAEVRGHSARALKEDGSLWLWGNVSGNVEFMGSDAPLRVGSDTDWVWVSGNPNYGIKADGSMWTFGQRRLSTGATGSAGG